MLKSHQVNSGVELRDEPRAALLALLYPGHGPGVRSLSQLGGQAAQADVVALFIIEAFHGFSLQLCHKARGNKNTLYLGATSRCKCEVFSHESNKSVLESLSFKSLRRTLTTVYQSVSLNNS